MEINNSNDFYKNIQLDNDGNVLCVLVSRDIASNKKGVSQYDTFKELELTEEGYLKIYTD
jgi:hypothetical protein